MESAVKGEAIVRDFMIENTHIQIRFDNCQTSEVTERILKRAAQRAIESFQSVPSANDRKPAP